MDKSTYLNVGLALFAGAAGYAAYAAWTRPSSNVVMQKRLGTSSGTGTTQTPVTKRDRVSEVYASLKPTPKTSSASAGVGSPPPAQSSSSSSSGAGTPSSTPVKKSTFVPNGKLRPGPNWNAWKTPVRPLTSSNGGDFVKIVEGVLNKKHPTLKGGPNVRLAQDIVSIAFQERFPLDLLLAWVGVEGNFLAQTTPNNSVAQAIGPLQMTPIAYQDLAQAFPALRFEYPGPSTLERIRAGVKYFRLLRSRHPECASSLTATFRVYGMGWGGYTAFKAACHNGEVTRTSDSSVWRREKEPLSRSYTGMIFTFAKLPLLHTMDWGAIPL
jgi:hypothetical protein